MDNLYVHLQSDSSPEFFPNNTICDFRNQLAGSLEIDPAYYEVALVQCSYVYNPPYIKAGKEVAQLRVLGSVIDYCDTVRLTDQIFSAELEYDLSLVDQNVFMLDDINFANYHNKSSDGYIKSLNLSDNIENTTGIYRITEHTVECRLGRTVESFDDLLSYVNEKLSRYQSKITYVKNANPNLIHDLHQNVQSIEFMGTYDGMFNRGLPYGWFNSNKINVKLTTLIFRIKVTIKTEYLGKTRHRHNLPINLNPFETNVISVPASKYYEDETPGSLKVQENVYSIILDQDVYDVDGLVTQLQEKIPAIQFKYQNNSVSLFYSENVFDFYDLKTSDQIKAVLGLTEITSSLLAENTCREERGIFRPFFGYGQQKMYIYVDIIENQFIGSQLAPLLRITDYRGQNATTTTQEFAHHHYVPLRNANLDQIHMYIRSESSDYLPIELGTFSATLHFRRKRF